MKVFNYSILTVFAVLVSLGFSFPADAAVNVSIPSGTAVPGCETTNSCYSPSTVVVGVGETVTWTNNDAAVHTVTSGTPGGRADGLFDSSTIMPGSTFSHSFSTTGTFDYFCAIHPWKTGMVTVSNVPPPTPSVTKSELLIDIQKIRDIVNKTSPGDNLMEAAIELDKVLMKIETIPNKNTENELRELVENTLISYLIASTPGGVHDYPVTCERNYEKVFLAYQPELRLVLSNSTQVGLEAVTSHPVKIDGICVPYIIKEAQLLEAHTTPTDSLIIDILPNDNGHIWISFSNSLINLPKGDSLRVKIDNNVSHAKTIVTDTNSVLRIPFDTTDSQIEISVESTAPYIRPLHQMNAGVAPKDVVCRDDSYELLIRTNNGDGICVFDATFQHLVDIGFGTAS